MAGYLAGCVITSPSLSPFFPSFLVNDKVKACSYYHPLPSHPHTLPPHSTLSPLLTLPPTKVTQDIVLSSLPSLLLSVGHPWTPGGSKEEGEDRERKGEGKEEKVYATEREGGGEEEKQNNWMGGNGRGKGKKKGKEREKKKGRGKGRGKERKEGKGKGKDRYQKRTKE